MADDASYVSRDEFNSALAAQRELLVSNGIARHEKALLRIEAVETAQNVFKEDLIRVPTQLDREAARIEQLFNEKLRALSHHVDDVQALCTAEQKATNEAVKAAFSSTEKIAHNHRVAFEQQMAKSEASFTKDLDGLRMLLNASQNTITTDIRNLTGRLDRGEALRNGQRQESGDRRENMALTTQVVAQVVGFAVLIVMVGGLWISAHAPQSGVDTKRVDDLISLVNSQNNQFTARLDALSARLNQFSPPPPYYAPPQIQVTPPPTPQPGR